MHIFHAAFTRVLGGLEQSYIDTTGALASRGHRVTALLRSDAPYRSAVAAHAAAMHTLNPVGFYDIRAAWRIRRLLTLMRPDAVIAHNARAIVLLHLAARGTGIPVIGVSHSYKTARTLRADALVVLSEHMREHFLDAGYCKPMAVVPNLIRLPQRLYRKPRGLVPVIGAIGRFTEEKGFADLLPALHRLRQSVGEFTLRLAGNGPDAAELKLQAGKLGLNGHIHWLGWVEDKAGFYASVDMLCLPSREDSFSMVVLEAFAHGVPIVVTDAFGPAGIIESGVDGIVVPRRDSEGMAGALEALIADPELSRRMAEAAWRKIQAYDFPAIAERWDNVLTDFISATRPAKAA